MGAQVPLSTVPVIGLAARPAPFNTQKHGARIIFSEDNSVAERMEPRRDCYGVVYTARQLPLGRVWRTTVLFTGGGWSGGLVSGCVL